MNEKLKNMMAKFLQPSREFSTHVIVVHLSVWGISIYLSVELKYPSIPPLYIHIDDSSVAVCCPQFLHFRFIALPSGIKRSVDKPHRLSVPPTPCTLPRIPAQLCCMPHGVDICLFMFYDHCCRNFAPAQLKARLESRPF